MDNRILQYSKRITKILINNFILNYNDINLYTKTKNDTVKNLTDTINKHKGDTESNLENTIISKIFNIAHKYISDVAAILTDTCIDSLKYKKFIIYMKNSLKNDNFKIESLSKFNHDKLNGLWFVQDRDNSFKSKIIKIRVLQI